MILLVSFVVIFPFYVVTANDLQISGAYKSKPDNSGYLILTLNQDGTAYIKEKYEGTIIEKTGDWNTKGNDVLVTYNGNEQHLIFHEKLVLDAYGSEKAIPGLITSEKNANSGLLDSVRLWRQPELKSLLNAGEITITGTGSHKKTDYISFTNLFITAFILSVVLGWRSPLLFSAISTILILTASYLLDEMNRPVLFFHMMSGTVFVFLWSALFKWLFKKGYKGKLDSKLQFINFGSARGARRTIIKTDKDGNRSTRGY